MRWDGKRKQEEQPVRTVERFIEVETVSLCHLQQCSYRAYNTVFYAPPDTRVIFLIFLNVSPIIHKQLPTVNQLGRRIFEVASATCLEADAGFLRWAASNFVPELYRSLPDSVLHCELIRECLAEG